MLSDEWLSRYVKFQTLEHKTLTQCDGDAADRGDYNSSPCTLYRRARKDIKHCLLDIPCTVMLNKENYYREYKGHTKWLSLISSHFVKSIFFGMTLLHAHAHYIGTVCAKYQNASVKALVQVDFLMYALSKHKHNPYLIGNRKNWLSSQSYHNVKN